MFSSNCLPFENPQLTKELLHGKDAANTLRHESQERKTEGPEALSCCHTECAQVINHLP